MCMILFLLLLCVPIMLRKLAADARRRVLPPRPQALYDDQSRDSLLDACAQWRSGSVRATVRGGYTISPLMSASYGPSRECLITCILKVDLGGVCGERSWMRSVAESMGFVDAYIERMLMSVILIKVRPPAIAVTVWSLSPLRQNLKQQRKFFQATKEKIDSTYLLTPNQFNEIIDLNVAVPEDGRQKT